MAEEIFDVCDEQDRVIGTAPRSVVHARSLLHRAVHIWVWNSRSELMIHLRTVTKDEYPSCYTSSASGHLGQGEDYSTAAARELQEELGLSGSLKWIGKLPAGAETAFEHTVLYFLTTDEPPQPDPQEIAEVQFHAVEEIERMVRETPQRFTPPFRSLFRAWRAGMFQA